MKKIDFLIVSIICIITLFIGLFLKNNNQNSDIIEIIIDNKTVDEISIYNNYIYIIDSDERYIYIYKNNDLIKTIENKYSKDIYNIITINDSKVIMSQSNCDGKDCMYMEINKDKKLPIICTNGIVIKISNNDFKSDIIISNKVLLK